jgi:hypothetical protein
MLNNLKQWINKKTITTFVIGSVVAVSIPVGAGIIINQPKNDVEVVANSITPTNTISVQEVKSPAPKIEVSKIPIPIIEETATPIPTQSIEPTITPKEIVKEVVVESIKPSATPIKTEPSPTKTETKHAVVINSPKVIIESPKPTIPQIKEIKKVEQTQQIKITETPDGITELDKFEGKYYIGLLYIENKHGVKFKLKDKNVYSLYKNEDSIVESIPTSLIYGVDCIEYNYYINNIMNLAK